METIRRGKLSAGFTVADERAPQFVASQTQSFRSEGIVFVVVQSLCAGTTAANYPDNDRVSSKH